jgi:actin-like ATPase involved in cell morphogenesis/tRNA A-37 threonylcarbamoyl transferase component Bud32
MLKENSRRMTPPGSVFVSYASEQRLTAEQIAVRLRAQGCDLFFDRDSLPPGEEYDQRIRRAVMECELFVFLVSPDSVREGSYTRTELEYVRGRWANPSRKVLPVMVVPTQLSDVPAYLTALTILRPVGNPAAEIVNKVLELLETQVESARKTELKSNREELLALLRGGEDGVRSWNELGNGRASLSGVDLSCADLRKADLGAVDLREANLHKANLHGARLHEADLRKAKLREANLSGANLSEADLRGADLRRADLCGSDLFGVVLADADRRAAKVDKATYANSRWSRVDVVEWKQAGAVLGDDLTELIRAAPSASYEPYKAADVDRLEELTRARERRMGTPAERDERQMQIDELVATLKRSPRRDDIVTGCKLVRILGKGNYGVVWQAIEEKSGAERAVKVFDSDRLGLTTSLYHFRRGVRAMKHLNGIAQRPNTIVKLFDTEDSCLAFSMTHLEGGDLSNIAERGWTLKYKLRVFERVCGAVQFAHDNGIIHRDIKPANIVMHGTDPVLTDFDIADLLFAKTKSSQAIGTVTYAAPEALGGKGRSAQTGDIYSLGRLLIFLITEDDPPLKFEPVPPLTELEKLVPQNRAIIKIIRKCTMLAPENRYQTVEELLWDASRYETEADDVGVLSIGANRSSGVPEDLEMSEVSSPPKPKYVIGIDLGTTNAYVAIVESGAANVIPNSGGYLATASMVTVTEAGKRVVGNIVRRQAIINAENTVYATKRIIGREWDSPERRNAVMTSSYTITEDKGDIRIQLGDTKYTVPEITAFVLQELKTTAENWVGEPVSAAVITVPVHFNESQRQATKDAAAIAGLDVIRLISEPAAAALAHGFGRESADAMVAIYHLGGGTFDITILETSAHEVFNVIGTTSDSFLGGEDFDARIIDWLVHHFQEEHGIDLRQDRMALQRLRDAAEKAKCDLSILPETTINLALIWQEGDKYLHLERSMSRRTLEMLTEDLVARTVEICAQALKNAGLNVEALDEVILIGGMTRMPIVRRAVAKFFKQEPRVGLRPDETVALGAAIQAAALAGKQQSET